MDVLPPTFSVMKHTSLFEIFGPREGMPVTVVHMGRTHGALTQVVERYATKWMELKAVARRGRAEPFVQNRS
jgi:hypothetical protein